MNLEYIYNVFKTIAIFIACIFGTFNVMSECNLCKPDLFKDVYKCEYNENSNCTTFQNRTTIICDGDLLCGNREKISNSFNAYLITSFLEFLILDITLVVWGCLKNVEFKYIVMAFKIITMVFCFPQLPLLIVRQTSCSMGIEVFIYSLISISWEWLDNLHRLYQWKYKGKGFFNIGTSL